MAPSPALRWSPRWEPMADNGHKRGRSFESGLTFKYKDDDLVLFNEMQNKDKDNFLLHTVDDFEESIAKLRHFSDVKLGISIPTRGEGSDLLNAEGDKNDYDWLLTPPDTPLFPSLDDEYPQPVNLTPRGRARSQPITSRSVTNKSYQTSSSPYRRSPSPRSSGNFAQMRGRPSSVPRSSPPPSINLGTSTRRSSTPPNKQSTPTSRSSTPTLQRASTSSSIPSSNYGRRGPSPVKARCGNSASPKLRGWQMNLPGFTSEVPPNLRTSLSDRSVLHKRGSSPAFANGRESLGKFGRKSMSPTSSRSVSSSNGKERDCFSSYSKHSMVSSGDDDEESLYSIRVGISRSSPTGKDGAWASNKTMSYARKPSRYSPTTSVPKRSFDSSLRLMDQHKTPQNMFRPLLSSVPATTFRPIFSRNSSLTTSSNASSEQGVFSVALDVEGIELEPTEPHVGWERSEDSENHEEVFLFDKVDEVTEVMDHEGLSRTSQNCGEILLKKFYSEDIHNATVHIDLTHFTDNQCDMDGHIMMAICSKCNKEFKVLDMNENTSLCQECAEIDRFHTRGRALTCAALSNNAAILRDVGVGAAGKSLVNNEVSEHKVGNITDFIQLLDQRESELSDRYLDRKRDINVPQDCSICAPQLSNHALNPSLKADIPEGTGISVLLLQGSGGSKWPILQGKTVSATNIFGCELSYSRDSNINSLQRNTGQDSASASSSVELGSSRQTETFIQHQFCRESEADNMRNDIDSNAQNTSIPSDIRNDCYESGRLKSECEQARNSTECVGYDSLREIILVNEERVDSMDQSNFNAVPSFPSPAISENCMSKHTDSCMTIRTSDSQNLDNLGNNNSPCSSATEIVCNEDCTSSIQADEHPQNSGSNVQNIGGTDISGCSEMEEDYTVLNCSSQNDNLDGATKSSSIVAIDLPCSCSELEDSHPECFSSHNPVHPDQFNGHSISQTCENDLSFSSSEPSTAVQVGNHEHSGIIIERHRGHMSRNLTLEEATDTILFCSSIIHDLAYRAATVGLEKDLSLPPEARVSGPTMPISGLRESWKMPCKHTPRSHKFKLKKMEPQAKSPRKEIENDASVHEFAPSIETAKPPKLESKCNCTVM